MKNILKRLGMVILVVVIAFVMAAPLQTEAAPKIKLNKKSATIYAGQSITLKLKGAGSAEQKWTTSKKSVAEVNEKGKVTAKKKGSATIAVTVNGKKYQCKIKVKNPTLNENNITLEPGEIYSLKLRGAKAKSWKSSNKKIAVVSKAGKVKAKKEGTAKIYCRANNDKTYICYVDVYEDDFDEDDDEDDDDDNKTTDEDEDEEDELPHEHVWNEIVTNEATCMENGLMTKTCLVCGTVETEPIPALGHDYLTAEWEEEIGATCDVEGWEILTCQRIVDDDICGEILDQRSIPMTEHEYELQYETDATCTEPGYAMYMCKNCGVSETEETEPLGHDEEGAEWEVTKEATETTEGIKSLICPVCGEVIRTEKIPKKEQGGSTQKPGEANVISEAVQELLDQILQICSEKNFEELCRLDFDSMDDVIDENDENQIQCYDTAGNIVDGYFYDGENLQLKQNFTGFGIGIRGQEMAIGNFVRGKAQGDLITMKVTVIDDFLMDEEGTEFKNPEVTLAQMYVENGVISGEVTKSFYSINGQNIPQVNEQYIGEVSLVHRSFMDNSFWEKFLFTGEVTYVSYEEDLGSGALEEERYSFFLKNGLLDKELNVQEDGEWLDTDGNPCDMLELFENEYQDDVCVFVSTEYFDKNQFEIVNVD